MFTSYFWTKHKNTVNLKNNLNLLIMCTVSFYDDDEDVFTVVFLRATVTVKALIATTTE
jgi:hypothetical protein